MTVFHGRPHAGHTKHPIMHNRTNTHVFIIFTFVTYKFTPLVLTVSTLEYLNILAHNLDIIQGLYTRSKFTC